MSERQDRIRVHIENKEYSVVGGSFQEMLAAVKQVAGRRFVGELKVWQLPGTAESISNQLAISGYELEGGQPLAEAPSGQPSAPVAAATGDRIRIKVGEHALAVTGGAFRDMLEVVKEIPGRRFDGEAKIWEIPGDVGVIKGMIEAAGFQLEGAEGIVTTPPAEMESPDFAETSLHPPPAPAFEEPDFFAEDDLSLPIEPPDWWDDDELPPVGFQGEDSFPGEPVGEEPNPFREPPAFGTTSGQSSSSASTGGDRIRIKVGDETFFVTGGSFKEMLSAIKNIPGRRFDGQQKVWEIPADTGIDSINQAIVAAGFMVVPE